MALGNAWHIPDNPEPRGRGGMRDPVGAIVPGTAVTIISGNQFQGGGGNPGNQLQDGSALLFNTPADGNWTSVPLLFLRTLDNNKYYSATLPPGTFQTGDAVRYYLRIAYDDHDTTFVHAPGGNSATTGNEATARATPFTFVVQDRAAKGQWGPVFALPNVAIHAHVLPSGRVLMWGRRDRPEDSLDLHTCTPFVWNPGDGQITNTPQPALADGTKVNLFCSGHAFLPDGRLLVVGGHAADSDGLSQAALYDSTTNTWTPTAPMITPTGEPVRRWYPTATTLPDGRVLVLSGSYIDPARPKGKQVVVVDLLQVWDNGTWTTITKNGGQALNFIGLPLYPRMHVASDGRVFMSGTNGRTLLLKTSPPGGWAEVGVRALGNRDYCPAVMYDVDKVIYIGGGNDANTHAPTAGAEIIDLGANPRQWRKTSPMKFPRRQHNATVLPDGTVLVTGGTRGGTGFNDGFNDLTPGQPVHVAELWDPATGNWTELAAESVDRCYHGTALLLPDATVLSAGSGEYRPDNVHPNDPEDSHRDGQIFLPPYLFKGERPEITSAPDSVRYGQRFDVGTARPNDVGKVSWVRLPSVTHSFDENQRINVLPFQAGAGKLTVTAPSSPSVCPPGHHMLFIVSTAGVPSVAKIIQITPAVAPGAVAGESTLEKARPLAVRPASRRKPAVYEQRASWGVYAREVEVAAAVKGTAVVVGITGTCPYGIGSCWGGVYEALGRLDGVDLVSPVPDTDDSTAEVFLADERLPALRRWHEQFRSIVNGTYEMRGLEVTLQGRIETRGGERFLAGHGQRPPVRLAPLPASEKIQWDHTRRQRRPLEPGEALAYDRLLTALAGQPSGQPVSVTGPLKETDGGYELHVRLFRV